MGTGAVLAFAAHTHSCSQANSATPTIASEPSVKIGIAVRNSIAITYKGAIAMLFPY